MAIPLQGLQSAVQPIVPANPLQALLIANQGKAAAQAQAMQQSTPQPLAVAAPVQTLAPAAQAQEQNPLALLLNAVSAADGQSPLGAMVGQNTPAASPPSAWASQPAVGAPPSQWADVQAGQQLPSGAPVTGNPNAQGSATPAQQPVQAATTGPSATPKAAAPTETKGKQKEASISDTLAEMMQQQKGEDGKPVMDKAQAKSFFEDTRVLNMLSSLGASLSSGESAGVALARGFNSYQAEDKNQKAAAFAASEAAYKKAQDSFNNKIKLGGLIINGKKADADAVLKQAQTDAAKAKIPLTQAQVKETLQSITESKQRMSLAQRAANRADAKDVRDAAKDKLETGVKPENYAKMLLKAQNDLEVNRLPGDESEFSSEQQARMRVNAALPKELRQFSQITPEEEQKFRAVLADPETPEETKQTLLARIGLIYGE